MKKLRCWKKGKHNTFHRKDSVELQAYGQKTKYPFIQVGKYYDSKLGKFDGYQLMLHTTHYSKTLKERITKPKAMSFAERYMEDHNTC